MPLKLAYATKSTAAHGGRSSSSRRHDAVGCLEHRDPENAIVIAVQCCTETQRHKSCADKIRFARGFGRPPLRLAADCCSATPERASEGNVIGVRASHTSSTST